MDTYGKLTARLFFDAKRSVTGMFFNGKTSQARPPVGPFYLAVSRSISATSSAVVRWRQ